MQRRWGCMAWPFNRRGLKRGFEEWRFGPDRLIAESWEVTRYPKNLEGADSRQHLPRQEHTQSHCHTATAVSVCLP